VAIFGYIAVQFADSTVHGVIGGTWKETRRRRMIDRTEEIRKLERMFEPREALAT
jgi:hypothetical protein